jgi:histidinol-phosphatase (PHP family)
MEEYVRAAVARGLRKIVFLEHLEIGINYPEPSWLTEKDFLYYQAEGERLREKFEGAVEVGLGIEVGFNPEHVQEICDFLDTYPWDRIGISYHFYKHRGRHYNMVSRLPLNLTALEEAGIDTVVRSYFATLKTALEVLPGTMVCHLDAVMRHHPATVIAASHQQQIEEIFQVMRRKNMALEVNTSGYKYRDMPYPHPRYIRRAAELGIPLAAGSDAHHPEDVGRFFERLAGFLEFQRSEEKGSKV